MPSTTREKVFFPMAESNALEIIDVKKKLALLDTFIRRQSINKSPISVLEAGCGHRWLLKLDGVEYFLTGVDLDRDALEMRKNVRKDLDEAIHGDLRTISFSERKFDVVYSAFVLEHIDGAEDVLSRMVNWLKPNGIVILEIPDPNSVKGFVTRITPHWFHVFYYRFLLGVKTAGKTGFGPYRTYFDPVVSRAGMRAFCERHRLEIAAEYALPTDGPRGGIARLLVNLCTSATGFLSLGSLSKRHADLVYVLRRS